MNLESQPILVQKSQKELFEFLTDIANFKKYYQILWRSLHLTWILLNSNLKECQ